MPKKNLLLRKAPTFVSILTHTPPSPSLWHNHTVTPTPTSSSSSRPFPIFVYEVLNTHAAVYKWVRVCAKVGRERVPILPMRPTSIYLRSRSMYVGTYVVVVVVFVYLMVYNVGTERRFLCDRTPKLTLNYARLEQSLSLSLLTNLSQLV